MGELTMAAANTKIQISAVAHFLVLAVVVGGSIYEVFYEPNREINVAAAIILLAASATGVSVAQVRTTSFASARRSSAWRAQFRPITSSSSAPTTSDSSSR
jgi:putative copper export protein